MVFVKVLVLGGTVFLSQRIAREYLARGHDVTCLARHAGERAPTGAHAVSADRREGVSTYEHVAGPWDCVVDVASNPVFVREALSALAYRTRHWTYVSSCSVYADQNTAGLDETQAIVEVLDETEVSSPENYAASKAACESWCHQVCDGRLLVVRPGLIVGAGDPSDRGGYWPARFARDDETVLVPVARDVAAQVIDVRDLAEWLVAAGEEGLTGTLNAVGDARPLSTVLDDLRLMMGQENDVVVAGDQWLLDEGVEPWMGEESLPLWIPKGQGFDGFTRRSNVAARRQGLALRSFAETVGEIHAFEETLGMRRRRRAGLSEQRERELIAKLAYCH